MTVKNIVRIALFAAMTVIGFLIAIPIIPAAPFLKINLAGLFVLLSMDYIGFKKSLIVLVIAAIFDFLIKGSMVGLPIDQLAFMIAVITMMIIIKKTNKIWLAVITVTLIMTILNYFIISPIYMLLADKSLDYIQLIMNYEYFKYIILIYPLFNLIQWTVIGVLYRIISKQVIKGKK